MPDGVLCHILLTAEKIWNQINIRILSQSMTQETT